MEYQDKKYRLLVINSTNTEILRDLAHRTKGRRTEVADKFSSVPKEKIR